jgi:hypothetical protein
MSTVYHAKYFASELTNIGGAGVGRLSRSLFDACVDLNPHQIELENFQKKLWLKKKFVVETQYCVTLDRVPEELYPEIAANDAQREEWVRLFAIDDIKGDLTTPGYSKPLTVDFLKANPSELEGFDEDNASRFYHALFRHKPKDKRGAKSDEAYTCKVMDKMANARNLNRGDVI